MCAVCQLASAPIFQAYYWTFTNVILERNTGLLHSTKVTLAYDTWVLVGSYKREHGLLPAGVCCEHALTLSSSEGEISCVHWRLLRRAGQNYIPICGVLITYGKCCRKTINYTVINGYIYGSGQPYIYGVYMAILAGKPPSIWSYTGIYTVLANATLAILHTSSLFMQVQQPTSSTWG